MIRVGTAGWATPRTVRDRFPAAGSGLGRYAGRFDCVEINTTFYRLHRASTYLGWAEGAPDGFRFAVKAPRTITHERRLAESEGLLDAFLAEIRLLGEKLGPLLVQLPPSAALDPAVADGFFRGLRERFDGAVACEPRHPTWFDGEAQALLSAHRIARVAADPARVPAAAEPGGWPRLAYWRLHGSPRMYYSAYGEAFLTALAARLRASDADETWCIFDNTTSGAAAADALILLDLLR